MEGVRRSSRVSMVDKNYQEDDDDIEIVGGSEMDKRVAEKTDKNFSKMTLKAQREAAEAFRNSRDNSTEEEEEEQVVKPHKVGRRGRKRKAVVEEDSDSDIEILDSSNEKRFSTDPECISITPISITPMSTTPISKKLFNNNNNNFSPSPTNMASWNKKPQEEEQWDTNKQSRDLVQVKSASGKTMLVERSKLERVMGERAKNTSTNSTSSNSSPVKRPNTRSSRMLENNSKATIKLVDDEDQPVEIILDGEPVFGDEKVKVDLKRKAQDGLLPSRRLRSRG